MVMLRVDIGSALIAILKRVRAMIYMIGMRSKKPYPEECVLIPLTGDPKLCIEDKCYQWDSDQNNCKLIVLERKI